MEENRSLVHPLKRMINNESKKIVVKLAAICANADGIDADGFSLPFESGSINDLGKEYGLSGEEIAAQVNLAKEGLSGVTSEDWAALASLDSESRNSIIEKCESIAQADSEYSDKEREVVSVLRAKLGV
ncbi:TerB family tellurite resistance protein [Akkermansiaceae bacterium]|nr:TerB family tellurite resistance protein [Akkermansiaceae bacterium]MDB4414661.1 TerB family tellurite resistance protein [bacterium]